MNNKNVNITSKINLNINMLTLLCMINFKCIESIFCISNWLLRSNNGEKSHFYDRITLLKSKNMYINDIL